MAELLTESKVQLLGQNSFEKIERAILYSSVLPPLPASFDWEVFREVCCTHNAEILPVDEVNQILEICKMVGLLSEQNGKLTINDIGLHSNLTKILDRYN